MKKSQPARKKPIVVAISGYFNPLHIGHLDMIFQAQKLGDKLIAIINNDYQVKLKGSVPFMSATDRLKIVQAIKGVDEVFLAIDQDYSVCRSLQKIKPDIFANGGDRKNVNDVPEYALCQKLNIKMVDGLGKKIRASSKIIATAKKKRFAKQVQKSPSVKKQILVTKSPKN